MSTRNDRDLDDLLSDDAGRIGASYRKLGKLEPPRRLDRNVLAEASRAVHGRPRSSRWLLGVGTAAGVLLAGGIAWRVNLDMAQQRETAPISAPAVETAPSDVIRVEPRAGANDNASRSDKVAPADDQPNAADTETSGAAVSESSSPGERKTERAKQKLDHAFVADPAIQKVVPTPARATAHKQEEAREQVVPMSPLAPSPRAAAAPMQMPMPEQSKAAQSMRNSAEAEGSATPAPMQEPASARDTDADNAHAPMHDGAQREGSSSSTQAAVIAEVDRIRALLRTGQRDAALEALHQLRRKHPHVVLPADLRALDG